jgi:threonine dehydrogenase-like Zn-dependent dehydrogenase
MPAASAFWVTEPGRGEIRSASLPDPGPNDVLVRTRFTGISRGTETLVFRGEVPPSQHLSMRAPFQEGNWPGPVRYGYLNVGVVEHGPPELIGRAVFCLYPHQTSYVVPRDAVTAVPDGIPARRAVLAGTMETAVGAVWDAQPRLGERVSVIGAGMVGLCTAAALVRGGVAVEVVDINAARASVAAALGATFAHPDRAAGDRDLVVHASATEAGLRRGLELLATEGRLVELSWYGSREVSLPLGEAFHSRRLTLKASQVGHLPPTRPAGRTHADRMAVAFELLRDPALDVLLTGESPFADLPRVMADLAAGHFDALCHIVTYETANGPATDLATTDGGE